MALWLGRLRSGAINGFNGAVIFATGDVVAQHLEHRVQHEKWDSQLAPRDMHRMTMCTPVGIVMGGVVWPIVYGFCEHKWPGRSMPMLLRKTALTIGILSFGGNWLQLLARRLLRGEETGSAIERTNEHIREVIISDLCVWPVYDFACYALVPPAFRPFSTSMVSTAWNTYTSMVAARLPKEVQPIQSAARNQGT